jgi:hypothetical protein
MLGTVPLYSHGNKLVPLLQTRKNNATNSMEQRPLEKLTVSQLVKKFPAFYGTRRFITAFTRARHLSLSQARKTMLLEAERPAITIERYFSLYSYVPVNVFTLRSFGL